jgi:hypothetical protein
LRLLILLAVLDMIQPDLSLQLDVKAYADPELVDRTTGRACEITTEHGTDDRIKVISFFTRGCLVPIEHEVSTRLVLWADYALDALVGGPPLRAPLVIGQNVARERAS